jgi:hypothetical protein
LPCCGFNWEVTRTVTTGTIQAEELIERRKHDPSNTGVYLQQWGVPGMPANLPEIVLIEKFPGLGNQIQKGIPGDCLRLIGEVLQRVRARTCDSLQVN